MTLAGETAATPQVPAQPMRRVTALDASRGVLLVVTIMVSAWLDPGPFMQHARWEGVTFVDTVFPLFVTLSGAGIAFAYRRRVSWRVTFRRAAVLLVAGLLYNAAIDWSLDVSTWRLTGPLQVYAVIVLVFGALHVWLRRARWWAVVTAVLAVAHTTLLLTYAESCPGGRLTLECNPSRAYDTALLGASHLYAEGAAGHDPEGLVMVLGAMLSAAAGCTGGHLVLSLGGTRRGVRVLATWAATLTVAAVGSAVLLEPMKRLWTPSFALGIAALAMAALAIGVRLLDLPERRPRAAEPVVHPLVALGRNSLLVYFGTNLVESITLTNGEPQTWARQAAEAVDVIGMPRASYIAVHLVLWVGLALVLHRRRIYIRA